MTETLTLTLPSQTARALRAIANQSGATLETLALNQLEKLASDAQTNAKPETPDERRARINAAIDEAQQHFAPLLHGGDAVSQLQNEKRADVERAMERGL